MFPYRVILALQRNIMSAGSDFDMTGSPTTWIVRLSLLTDGLLQESSSFGFFSY